MHEKYNFWLRILHWLIGVMTISLLIVGWFMTSIDKDSALFKLKYSTFYPMHKAFGITLLALLIIRVIVRLSSTVPQLPQTLNIIEKITTKSVHFLLYILPLTIAISGYVMSSASQKAIHMFFFNIPLLINHNPSIAKTSHTIHIVGVKILAALIILHILGFLKHLIIDKTNLLPRIT